MINLLDALLNSHAVKLFMTSKRDCGHIVCSTVHHDSPWVCGKEYDSFTRCSLYLCCSLFAQRVYTVFSFHYVDHSFFLLIILVCALSCLEWKVKFISIKSKSFVFLSFERASKHHPHTSTHTHTRAELFKWLIVWPISVMGSNVIRDWFRHRALIMD